jgi:predicted nucleic-acid-binding Zn-ribbon protein
MKKLRYKYKLPICPKCGAALEYWKETILTETKKSTKDV